MRLGGKFITMSKEILGVPIYALMRGRKQLGKFEIKEDILVLVLNPDVNENELPYMIKLNYRKNLEVALEKWVKGRLLQKDRIGVKSILKRLGIFKYNEHDLFECSHASTMKDAFWIAFTDKDTFEECTQRGIMGVD